MLIGEAKPGQRPKLLTRCSLVIDHPPHLSRRGVFQPVQLISHQTIEFRRDAPVLLPFEDGLHGFYTGHFHDRTAAPKFVDYCVDCVQSILLNHFEPLAVSESEAYTSIKNLCMSNVNEFLIEDLCEMSDILDMASDNLLPDTSKEAIGSRLVALRMARGWTSATIARAIGVSAQRWNNYERGLNVPPPDLLAKLWQISGVSADYVLFGRMDGMSLELIQAIKGAQPSDIQQKRA